MFPDLWWAYSRSQGRYLNIVYLLLSAYLLLPLFRISTILRCHKIRAHYFAPTNQFLFDSVARLFAVINCASNFIIYCMVGTQFRAELLLMVGYEVRSEISRIEVGSEGLASK